MEKEKRKKLENRQVNWDMLVDDLLDKRALYHKNFYKKGIFTGPSLHFHRRALSAKGGEKMEMVYAVLVSWGMHRMGKGGAKMRDWNTFAKSISKAEIQLQSLGMQNIQVIEEVEFQKLKHTFNALKIMKSKRKIVAVSKVLAHYLPNLIAPIDNEYTFRFIFDRATYPSSWLDEFELFKEIHLNLYQRVTENALFKSSAEKWRKNSKFQWDTSLPKIVDNLIIGKRVYEKELLKMKQK